MSLELSTSAQLITMAARNKVFKLVKGGDVDALEELLSISPAIVHDKNKQGSTPLHIACAEGDEEAALCLLKHGALPTDTDKQGRTAFLIGLEAQMDVDVLEVSTEEWVLDWRWHRMYIWQTCI